MLDSLNYFRAVYLTDAGEHRDASSELAAALERWSMSPGHADDGLVRESLDRIHRTGRGLSAFCYGWMHQHGVGVDEAPDVGAAWYAKAAEVFRREAEAGLAASKNNLGYLLATGRGVPRNPVRAADLFKDAADAGLAQAQFNLAVCTFNGWGVPANMQRCMDALEELAAGGDPKALFVLGHAHCFALGVPLDLEKGLSFTRAAADAGEAEAWMSLMFAARHGYSGPPDAAAEARWLDLAATAGNKVARLEVALTEAVGPEPGTAEEAFRFLEWNAERGDDESIVRLAETLLRGGPYRPPDAARAFQMLDAAAQGDDPSYNVLTLLGSLHLRGLGTDREPGAAAAMYRRAALKGHKHAQAQLGRLHRDGLGVKIDLLEAAFWLSLAAPVSATGAAADLEPVKARLTLRQVKWLNTRVKEYRSEGAVAGLRLASP